VRNEKPGFAVDLEKPGHLRGHEPDCASVAFDILHTMVYAGSKTFPTSYSQQQVGAQAVQTVAVLEPADHLGRCVLQRLVQRARVPLGSQRRPAGNSSIDAGAVSR